MLIDTATLETLPTSEYRSGLAEVVKYGVILDAELFDYLEANAAGLDRRNSDVLAHVIARCCRLKADVVEQDEREETGLRAVLNYGHTFGHAFETLSRLRQRVLHGEAVAIGMVCAARLAERLGRVDPAFVERQHKLLESPGTAGRTAQARLRRDPAAMMHDKKVEHGRLRFVLPSRLGTWSWSATSIPTTSARHWKSEDVAKPPGASSGLCGECDMLV